MAAAGVTTAGESAAGRPGGDGDDKKPPLSLALLALAAGGKKKKPIERKPDKFYYQNFSVQSYFKVSLSLSHRLRSIYTRLHAISCRTEGQ